MDIRLRYAPSPTGLQHLGGIRTALFCYLTAKTQGGRFILRIEDTDRSRYHPDALQDLYATLSWLGISWDEGPNREGDYGPYLQSSRIELYHEYIEKLIQKNIAYRSEEERSVDGKAEISTVVRLRLPETGSIKVRDNLLGDLEFQFDAIPRDPVLLKSDGFPTYHFASVVDDYLMKITHVLRSQEWVSSLPIHWYLYESLQWKKPAFYHLPLIIGNDGKKLSKRHGATSVLTYRDAGVLPQAMWNFLVLLGWSYDDKEHFFSQQDLLKLFSVQGINKSQAMFDQQRLYSLNAEHIRALSREEFFAYCQQALQSESDGTIQMESHRFWSLASLLQERCSCFADIREHWYYVGYAIKNDDGKRFAHLSSCDEGCRRILDAMIPILNKLSDKKTKKAIPFSQDNDIELNHQQESEHIVNTMKDAATKLGVTNKVFFMCVQESITGQKKALPVARVILAIGLEEAIARLEERRKDNGV